MAGGGIEIEAGNAAEFDAVFHVAGGDDEFAEIGERNAGGAIAKGAGGLKGGADIGGSNIFGADNDGAGQENESGSREKTLGNDKYPARGLKTARTGAALPSGGAPTASCAGCLTELLRFFVSSVKS
nr:hypothetical protein [Rhizobium leguminosarum]